MLTTLHDFTDDLCNTTRSWASGGRRFREQFPAAVRATQVGLYVLIHANESDHPIYDRNREGRLLIGSNAIGVKYGKFENGFLERMLENYKHLHRRHPDGSEEAGVFTAVLRYALVLDLSELNCGPANPAAIFEAYWNPMLEETLRSKGWVARRQSARSESRLINPGTNWCDVRSELAVVAPKLEKRIREAAEILAKAPLSN